MSLWSFDPSSVGSSANPNGNLGVFVNALRIEANRAPTTRIFGATMNSGNLLLAVMGQHPNQTISFEQNDRVDGGSWVPAVDATPVSTNGMVLTVGFPLSSTLLFYRATSPIVP